MRALILVLAAVVVSLAVSILLYDPPAAPSGPVFPANRLISDAAEGEETSYTNGDGHTILFHVDKALPAGPDRPPSIRVHQSRRDRTGSLIDGGSYEHLPTVHFLFPLTAPQDPNGFDRVWIWQRIRRETVEWRGRPRTAWRIDCIDPALPPDQDTVVVWMDEAIPVYGILRWQRGGQTWTLANQSFGRGS